MNAIRRLWVSESGVALVEAALCMPFLMMFLIGVIDLGRLAQFEAMLVSGSHAGAQYGTHNATMAADLSGMASAATSNAPPGVIATASSYYKCQDGIAPVVSATSTMANTSSIICASPSYKLLYVFVTTSGTFQPLFLSFLTYAASQNHTAIMQVPK